MKNKREFTILKAADKEQLEKTVKHLIFNKQQKALSNCYYQNFNHGIGALPNEENINQQIKSQVNELSFNTKIISVSHEVQFLTEKSHTASVHDNRHFKFRHFFFMTPGEPRKKRSETSKIDSNLYQIKINLNKTGLTGHILIFTDKTMILNQLMGELKHSKCEYKSSEYDYRLQLLKWVPLLSDKNSLDRNTLTDFGSSIIDTLRLILNSKGHIKSESKIKMNGYLNTLDKKKNLSLQELTHLRKYFHSELKDNKISDDYVEMLSFIHSFSKDKLVRLILNKPQKDDKGLGKCIPDEVVTNIASYLPGHLF